MYKCNKSNISASKTPPSPSRETLVVIARQKLLVEINLKNKAIYISIIISLTCLFFLVKANIEIAEIYKNADGKTKALFGITELGYFYSKFLYIIPLLYSLVTAIYSTKNGTTKASKFTIGLALFTILIIFVDIWKWLI